MSIAIIRNANKLGFFVGIVYVIRVLQIVIVKCNTVSSSGVLALFTIYIQNSIPAQDVFTV